MRNTLILLSSLLIVGCGGGDSGTTVTAEETGTETSADTGSSTTEDTGASTTEDTGSSTTEDTGTASETGGDTGTAGETGADTGSTMDAPAGDTAGAATFTQVYMILSSKCGGCHTTGTSGNLDMKNKATAYGELVGKKAEGGACSAGGMTRVIAGNAANSLLIHKLTMMDSMVCGDRMPQGRAPLSMTELNTIRSWINAGALNN